MELSRFAVPEQVLSDQALIAWADFGVPLYGNLLPVSPQMLRHVERRDVENLTRLPLPLLLQLSPLGPAEVIGNAHPVALAASKPR